MTSLTVLRWRRVYLVDVQPKNTGSKMAATGMMSSFTTWLSAIVSSSPSTFVLESTAGFHRGVRLALEPGDVRIGSTPGADIVLRDAGIAAEHAVLRVGRRTIDLHAIGGEVRVGENIIANGYGCALQAPIDLTIGEARLRISIERNQAASPNPVEPGEVPARRRIPTAVMIAGALLLTVPALGLAAMRPAAKANDLTSVTRAEAPAPGNETLTLAGASKLMADLPADDRKFIEHCLSARPGISVREAIAELNGCDRQPPPNLGSALNALNVDDAGRKLTERLEASGLSGLRVTSGRGQVVVTGSITKQQTGAWTEAQQWFDEAYRGRLVLVANVTSPEAKKPAPVVNVQAVWFGERPYIITAEGNRYYKGAFLDNGWMIKDIVDGRILLAKDGETLALVYRQ
ncbi:FHA domain-containing protein [Bradyrhizobium sp. BWA-3-5]|uniref:SctD/MshK family protein n=1 Tax=Bradyrhizobium sp. BWA-3-5 TaxID=3080013 RepID=UPI00293E0ADA|nr:FHA domain-containing protein [Bradyrhizobium sp. BWA-3-5]WOH65192.1 FHA domain-containing protein [Bradyrhizobium sp. BWA-3-5]